MNVFFDFSKVKKMELSKVRTRFHVKNAEVFLRYDDGIICEVIKDGRGKTFMIMDLKELNEINTDELTEEIQIDYYIDRNYTLDIGCCVCYNVTSHKTSCGHDVCMVCCSKIIKCPICRFYIG